jgi:hypothetical protein
LTDEAFLRQSFRAVEVNDVFDEASLTFADGGKLFFRHRVGERWVKAEAADGLAARVLASIVQFRLNGKHLDLQFRDGSRWEARFGR